MARREGTAQWISMSDLMTGLMLIFLLISVAFMYDIQIKQKQKDKALTEYNESKVKLYNELKNRFEKKEKEW